jgi:hypothetical protein
MKRSLATLSLVCLVLLSARAHGAARTTNALAFGIELCPQFICGSAIFTGVLSGEVAGIQTSQGAFTVLVNHDDLPTVTLESAAITGGSFQLRAGARTFRGSILGGTLTLAAPGEFAVQMLLVSPTAGPLVFQGTLSHNTFPPTISGHIFSAP